ncbi:MAG: Rrf2 family transcriptional regulator [Kiritimatiellales bacterium]|nr:Rrf2 family transcriptional regulator [Kiritimatiellales bacterium]
MISVSHTTSHAIRALACLAGCADPPASIKDVAACADVPQAYLAKIVKKLNDSGIIESKRGHKGGIWLARPAKLISLLEICIALEGDDFLGTCLLGSECCSDDRDCPTHQFWMKNRELIRREFDRIKLSDVLAFYRERGLHHMPTVEELAGSGLPFASE